MDKNSLRKLMIEKRNKLQDVEKEALNKKILSNLINSNWYKNSETIFIFVSYNNEIDTHTIIKKALEDGKTIVVPKVISKQEGMVAKELNSFDDLEIGTYSILEPKNYCTIIDPQKIDLILVPGLAFDKSGGRIGYGGGFYDRFLNSISKSCAKIGLAYSFQIIDYVPMDENDIKIDGFITD